MWRVKIDKFQSKAGANWYWSLWNENVCMTMHDGFNSPGGARQGFREFAKGVREVTLLGQVHIRLKENK